MQVNRRMAKALKAWAMIAGGMTAATPLLVFTPAFAADPVKVDVSGKASVAAGLVDGEAKADADAEIKVRGSTVFANGVELGAVVEGRFDKQQPNQLFGGGRYSSLLIGGPRGVGPLTSDAYLQGAYGYVRGSFGQLIVGRDHGVARTFAVTAPTIFQSVNVNDWRTDLSGLNDVHTVNDFSGYSTKISYLPPANFLGGVLGGLQLGVSYSPAAAHCGEDLCAPEDRLFLTPSGALLTETSRWDDVVEAAAYYQKEVKLGGARNGLLFGVGASYVSANEDARVSSAVFDDYRAYSLGMNLGYRGLTLGGSVKSTNSGLAEVDDQGYLAFDAGITFRTGEDKGDWGVMLGYGQAEANVAAPPNPAAPLVFRDTKTTQAGVTYFVGRGITVGAAAQYVESEKPPAAGGPEDAATVVIESSIRF
ncbi:MAG: porin [Parvularculaceae bacterium]|nr:porin [Parvularculaceae bacterium]